MTIAAAHEKPEITHQMENHAIVELRYAVVLEPDPGGGFSVSVPALPEAHTQGDSVAEAVENAREAILAVVADRRRHGEEIPPSDAESIRVERVSVTVAA